MWWTVRTWTHPLSSSGQRPGGTAGLLRILRSRCRDNGLRGRNARCRTAGAGVAALIGGGFVAAETFSPRRCRCSGRTSLSGGARRSSGGGNSFEDDDREYAVCLLFVIGASF